MNTLLLINFIGMGVTASFILAIWMVFGEDDALSWWKTALSLVLWPITVMAFIFALLLHISRNTEGRE